MPRTDRSTLGISVSPQKHVVLLFDHVMAASVELGPSFQGRRWLTTENKNKLRLGGQLWHKPATNRLAFCCELYDTLQYSMPVLSSDVIPRAPSPVGVIAIDFICVLIGAPMSWGQSSSFMSQPHKASPT